MVYLTAGFILVFLSVFCFSLHPVIKKLDSKNFAENLYFSKAVSVEESFFKRLKNKIISLMGIEYQEKLRIMLLQADMENVSVETVVFTSITASVIAAALFSIILTGYGNILTIFGFIAGAFAGFKIPEAYIKRKADRRKDILNATILYYVELLSTACQAGLNTENAIERIANNTNSILADEIKRIWKESYKTKTREEAIQDMIQRCGTNEVRLFMESVGQGLEMGTPITDILKEQAKSIRSRAKSEIVKKGELAKVKIVFPMVLFLLPSVLLVAFTPALLTLMKVIQEF